jgi:hypothetical protein
LRSELLVLFLSILEVSINDYLSEVTAMRFAALIALLTILSLPLSSQTKTSSSLQLRGPYLGQTPPGDIPTLFAPGTVSTGLYERDLVLTADGKELYYGVFVGGWATIMVTRLVDGKWTEPAIASFASNPGANFIEPCISRDGKRMLFLSTLPPAGEKPKPGWGHQNIWYVDRLADGSWSQPIDLGSPINTPDQEYFPSLTRDGTLYFTHSSGGNNPAIFRSSVVNDKYSTPEKLPFPVNGPWSVYNTCIAPDESYLVACVSGKDTTLPRNASRYCISFRTDSGGWTELVDMGDKINLPTSTALSPSISPDGKFFFFALSQPISPSTLKNLKVVSDILELHASPFNGSSNIYWVSTQIIEGLRKKKGMQ